MLSYTYLCLLLGQGPSDLSLIVSTPILRLKSKWRLCAMATRLFSGKAGIHKTNFEGTLPSQIFLVWIMPWKCWKNGVNNSWISRRKNTLFDVCLFIYLFIHLFIFTLFSPWISCSPLRTYILFRCILVGKFHHLHKEKGCTGQGHPVTEKIMLTGKASSVENYIFV